MRGAPPGRTGAASEVPAPHHHHQEEEEEESSSVCGERERLCEEAGVSRDMYGEASVPATRGAPTSTTRDKALGFLCFFLIGFFPFMGINAIFGEVLWTALFLFSQPLPPSSPPASVSILSLCLCLCLYHLPLSLSPPLPLCHHLCHSECVCVRVSPTH